MPTIKPPNPVHVPFGPYAALMPIHKGLVNGLLKRGSKLDPPDDYQRWLLGHGDDQAEARESHLKKGNKRLAGILHDQRFYPESDRKWFVKQFQPYVDSYVEGYAKFLGMTYSEPEWSKSFNLYSLWINYMQEHEYNPRHTHDGNLSFVIFLKIPDLTEEREAYQGNSGGPGSICFHYGQQARPNWATTTHAYFPSEGYIWIFPSLLVHEVYPYHTPGQRITVSGNLNYIDPSQKSQPC